ncbi:MAG TPA: hypothetical protein PKE26_14795 [Kiritimatiellia bacterium]|nr:hypothetical protein [Kiritimatiellia bacterium]HMP00368.1 hypothetical protein [Kiritimatiellia bacterium]
MRNARQWVLAMAVGAAGFWPVYASTPSFDRYQVILNRKPFGAPPPPSEPVRPPPPRADSFAKSLRLSMIIETDDGEMRIGFVDNRTGRSYSLVSGEAQDGIELVSASFEDEEAVLRHGDEMALLKISAGGSFEEIAPSDQQARLEAARNRPSYAERRRQRMEQQQQQMQPQPPPEPKYTGEELTKHLYEYQMEVIRQGLPPLPIPLTPEQDAQLVAEGYLPPID